MSILSNIYFILVLRIAHIAGGVILVGSAILYLFLLIPAARSAESAGQKFMQTLGPRFGKMMGIVTTVTVLSGALLYARYLEAGLAFMWTTHAGLAFTIGALAARPAVCHRLDKVNLGSTFEEFNLQPFITEISLLLRHI